MEKQPWLDTTNHSKPQKGIGINLYAMAEVLFFIALLILISANNGRKAAWHIFFDIVVVDAILCLVQLKSSNCVYNRSGKTILCKNEDDNTIFTLKNGETAYHIDGYKHGNNVFKVADGTHVVVNEDGSFQTLSVIGSIENHLRGCTLSAAPDNGWKNLFEHSIINENII